ncbi:hypothetical protein QE152_g31000 [Popillia japonica]|uniref:Uncharacterized protein n=1 Tax=Popillia japonica TaxID=7064 RepID=A0AAW1JC65_POPJA
MRTTYFIFVLAVLVCLSSWTIAKSVSTQQDKDSKPVIDNNITIILDDRFLVNAPANLVCPTNQRPFNGRCVPVWN